MRPKPRWARGFTPFSVTIYQWPDRGVPGPVHCTTSPSTGNYSQSRCTMLIFLFSHLMHCRFALQLSVPAPRLDQSFRPIQLIPPSIFKRLLSFLPGLVLVLVPIPPCAVHRRDTHDSKLKLKTPTAAVFRILYVRISTVCLFRHSISPSSTLIAAATKQTCGRG